MTVYGDDGYGSGRISSSGNPLGPEVQAVLDGVRWGAECCGDLRHAGRRLVGMGVDWEATEEQLVLLISEKQLSVGVWYGDLRDAIREGMWAGWHDRNPDER
jgi:hypothetical protein